MRMVVEQDCQAFKVRVFSNLMEKDYSEMAILMIDMEQDTTFSINRKYV